MIGLSGTRVIVIDDVESEALPIMQAFARRGVATAYFDGEESSLPSKEERLCGVRLAILDMDLLGGGASDSSKAAKLAKYIGELLAPDNGPYAAIIWTKHHELIEEFEKYIFVEDSIPKPVVQLLLMKAECKNDDGDLDLDIISRKLVDAMKAFSPLMLLYSWEEASLQSANDVINRISSLSVSNSSNPEEWREHWKSNLLKQMHLLAEAEAGQHLDESSYLSSLFGVFNPLLTDRVENRVPELAASLADYSRDVLAATPDLDNDGRAKLNVMLHLTRDNLINISPGNVYNVQEQADVSWCPTIDELSGDLIQGNPITEETKQQIHDSCKLVLLEVSPVCDHAQKNIRYTRLVAGLLAPQKHAKKFKKAQYIHQLGSFWLDERYSLSPDQYSFFFSARHLVTVSRESFSLTPFARFRGQLFAVIQNWFANHAIRPGMVFFYPSKK